MSTSFGGRVSAKGKLTVQTAWQEFRCSCNRLMGEFVGGGNLRVRIVCKKCGKLNVLQFGDSGLSIKSDDNEPEV